MTTREATPPVDDAHYQSQINELTGSLTITKNALAAITRETDPSVMHKIANAALAGIPAPIAPVKK